MKQKNEKLFFLILFLFMFGLTLLSAVDAIVIREDPDFWYYEIEDYVSPENTVDGDYGTYGTCALQNQNYDVYLNYTINETVSEYEKIYWYGVAGGGQWSGETDRSIFNNELSSDCYSEEVIQLKVFSRINNWAGDPFQQIGFYCWDDDNDEWEVIQEWAAYYSGFANFFDEEIIFINDIDDVFITTPPEKNVTYWNMETVPEVYMIFYNENFSTLDCSLYFDGAGWDSLEWANNPAVNAGEVTLLTDEYVSLPDNFRGNYDYWVTCTDETNYFNSQINKFWIYSPTPYNFEFHSLDSDPIRKKLDTFLEWSCEDMDGDPLYMYVYVNGSFDGFVEYGKDYLLTVPAFGNYELTAYCSDETYFSENVTLDLTFSNSAGFECIFDETPYIKESFGTDRNRIYWVCSLDEKEYTYDCFSYVSYDGDLIQANPEQELTDAGVIDSFKSNNGIVKPYFLGTDLRNNKTVTFSVLCGGSQNQTFTYEANVTPIYKEPYEIIDRGAWFKDTATYWIGGFILLTLLIIGALGFIKWMRGED